MASIVPLTALLMPTAAILCTAAKDLARAAACRLQYPILPSSSVARHRFANIRATSQSSVALRHVLPIDLLHGDHEMRNTNHSVCRVVDRSGSPSYPKLTESTLRKPFVHTAVVLKTDSLFVNWLEGAPVFNHREG